MRKQLRCDQLEWHDLRVNERDLPAIDEEYRDELLSKLVLVLSKNASDPRTTPYYDVAYYDYVNESWVDSAGNIVWCDVIAWSYLPEINL